VTGSGWHLVNNAGWRILVVDDDLLVRQVMVDALQDVGFEVLEASGGAEACRIVDDPDNVALIVTDLNMPDFDGIAVANWARLYHPNIPVLFVSGRPDLLMPLAGPCCFLAKPFSMEQLTKTVGELLDQPWN
jgi:CheY-like chemotaxis protein